MRFMPSSCSAHKGDMLGSSSGSPDFPPMTGGAHPIPRKNSQAGLESQLESMREMNKILSTDSCMDIYVYLMLFGKSTPANLRNVTGFSKATVFRSLAMMLHAGVLEQESDPNVPDKRYAQQYFVSKDIMVVNKELYSAELAAYAESHQKGRVVSDWLSGVESLALTLNRHATQLLASMSTGNEPETSCCRILTKMIAFRIADAQDPSEIEAKLRQFIDGFDRDYKTERRDWRTPIRSPVVLSMSFMSVNTEGDQVCPASPVEKPTEPGRPRARRPVP